MRNYRFFLPLIKTSHLLLIAALAGTLLAAPAQVARAATLQVDNNNRDLCSNETGQPYCDIQPAIDDAESGDTINVASGQYFERLTIGKSLIITGGGIDKTTIDGQGEGRVVNIDGPIDVTISGVTIRNGQAANGGGIQNGSKLTLIESEVSGNSASTVGGGIVSTAGATLTLNDSSIFDNQAGDAGGGIYNARGSTLQVTGSSIISNTVSNQDGGGLYNAIGAGATLAGTEVAENTAPNGDGGGIANAGTLSLQATIRDNTAANGGGVANTGTLTVTNVTISSNSAGGNGGGILNSGALILASATVAFNSAGSESDGGGIYQGSESTITLRNTILAENDSGASPDCFGTLTSQGYNLLGSDLGCSFQGTETDQVGNVDAPIDPLLGELADNGGPTETHALLENSPAIDAGNPAAPGSGGAACPATDQRGAVRPQGASCDIGAFEASLVVGEGETRYVATNGRNGGIEIENDCLDPTAPCRTIGFAIGKASAGDTISITVGIYTENLTVTKSLSFIGAGAGATIVDGDAQGRVMTILAGVTARVSGMRIQNGDANGQGDGAGGGLRSAGTLILIDSAVSGNTAATLGGGIFSTGTLSLTNSTVSGNTGSGGSGSLGGGGGIYSSGALSIVGGTIAGNQGGGIVNAADGAATLVSSTVSGNVSSDDGGGIANFGSLEIDNSTVSGNRASANGGGVANNGDGELSIHSSTIAGNAALGSEQSGGGIYVGGGSASLSNTIVARNTSASGSSPDCAGTLVSQGYNLIGDASGCDLTQSPTDLIGDGESPIDPQLGVLRDNGGLTFTQLIPPGSPAADAGDPAACPTNDQRGAGRPQGGGCDIGAYEVRVFRPGPLSTGDRDAPRLVFISQPTRTVAGEQLLPAPEVAVRDAAGNPAGYTGSITLTLVNSDNVPGAALSGTTVLTPNSQGVAQYHNLSISPAGTGYRLRAEATGVLSAESALLIVALQDTPSEPEPEHELNDTIEQANKLLFDRNGFTARVGLITTTEILTPDLDVFSFWARPGTAMTITLTGRGGGDLPADYDLLIAPDPRSTLYISDEIDLDNLADLPRAGVPRAGVPRAGVPRAGVPRAGVPRAGVGGISETIGNGPEKITGYLPTGGQYFVIVYGGTADQLNPDVQYQLDVTLQDSSLVEPAFRAHPIPQLNLVPDSDVRTIYIEHPLRLQAYYPGADQAPALGELASAVSPGSSLLALDNTIGKGKGATIDLRTALLPADYNDLVALYNQWDERGEQPLLANEAAQQIWFVLDRALTSYYTGTTDIVLIGGDDILPFYRVPDETELANEGEYLSAVGADLDGASPLSGSLYYHFIQTDNFYADRQPTPWRGRALYLPDMGIGRLVEQPSDIMHYLNGYLEDGKYTIDATAELPAQTGVLVTGYDFLVDQAKEISSTFELLGFHIGGTPALSTTIGQDWDAQQLADAWFSGQLGQLKDGYNPVPEHPDIYTRYHLTALNGHFDHAYTVPATGTQILSASLLLTPTAAFDSAGFFKIDGAPTLIYSVGCHSGLNAIDGDFGDPEFQVDFAQVVLKHGGNWIGNTGYGIGDTDLIGYSEKLSLKFTEAIGRKITDTLTTDPYYDPSIGRSLASAKIQYLRSAGSNTFSVYDEKILAEMTLYGLPFIRVKVPNPQLQPALPAIPEATWKSRVDADGLFTRTITLDTSFITDTLQSGDQVLRATSQVRDEFLPTQVMTLTSEDQTPLGRPVLPLLTYDITLQADRAKASGEIPAPRGVRLLSVETLETVDGFDPHITSAVSDVLGVAPQEPPLTEPGLWSPGVPFASQRTSEKVPGVGVQLTDRLLVYPAQFNAGDDRTGRLRRFSRMVFEITYLDPAIASQELENLRQRPYVALSEMEIRELEGDDTVLLSAALSDLSGRGIDQVTALYTTDGATWQLTNLAPLPEPGRWQAELPSLGHDGFAFLMASDNAGHVSAVATNAITAGTGLRVRPAHAAHFVSADFYLDDQLLDDSLDSREVQEYVSATPGVHRVYLRPEHSDPTSPVLFAADTPPLLDGHDYTLMIVGRPGALGLVVVDETAPAPPAGQALMHFVNANRVDPGWDIGPIDVYLDGALRATGLPVGQTTDEFIVVAPGTHEVWFFQAGKDPAHDRALTRKTFTVAAGQRVMVGTGRHDDDDGDISDFEQRAIIGRDVPR